MLRSKFDHAPFLCTYIMLEKTDKIKYNNKIADNIDGKVKKQAASASEIKRNGNMKWK